MASRNCVFLLLILVLKTISGATFENISLILKWRSGMQDNKTVTVRSDDYLRSYVGEFGEVIIEHQNVALLTPYSVSNMPKVTHLHLTDCGLRRIEIGAFKNLPELTDLNLSGNLLERIENGVFDSLGFTTLYLENNRIGSIGDTAFNNLKMEYLFIDDNRISGWKNDWFNGTPLRSISMRNNLLKNVPRLAFEYLWHHPADVILENFILNNNSIEYIDPDAFEGVKLIYSLNLQNNSLIRLEPGLFDTVHTIDQIDLSDNKLSEVYYETFRNTQVLQLNIYNNFITCISTDVFNATKLQKLNVGNNPVSCKCVSIWTKWKEENQNPEIINFAQLKEGCKSATSGIYAGLLVYVSVFLLSCHLQ